MSHFVAYILQFQEIIVYKIPPGGEGVYSQPKVYKLEVLCSNQSVTGGLIRPTNISLPSKVLISAAVESKALIQISINHSLHYFINFPCYLPSIYS